MTIDKNNPELCWISLILRVAMASLFAMAALGKFTMGLDNVAGMITGMFKNTFLPGWLLTPYAYGIAFAEALIAVWLLVGIKLREAWIFTAFVCISLAFGMVVAKQGTTASENYIYVLMACAGLYFSRYDGCGLGNCGCKK